MIKLQIDQENWWVELGQHRIAKIGLKRVRSRYPRLYGKNSRLPEHSYGIEFCVEEVETDQGARGWAFNGAYDPARVDSEAFRPFLGRLVTDLIDPRTGILDEAVRPLDFSLHDLAGQILGMPVSRMINQSSASQVACYDGAIYMNDISPDSRPGGLSAVLDDCRYDYEMGYRAFKVKIGRGGMWMETEDGLRRDIEVTRMVRKHFPDSPILVDGNDAFRLPGLLRYIDAVADVGLYWIEEPFAENREDLLRLREHLAKKSPKTLIADGEYDPDINLLMGLAEEKLVDVLLMDVHGLGFTRWRNLQTQTLERGYVVSPHCWGAKLKTHYTAHLAAAYPNFTMIEGVPELTEGVDFEGYALVDGMLSVPERPGFGMDLVWGRPIWELSNRA
jgi:D-galactarolactone cycloisomerase